ncbi:MAG: hypothetical protein DRP45_02570 [Candidatus Zixiibacteriota bacterium]|nr:MAG: hypothetical protein DRP45_02570 [candidate division Zixibacteria bacterium]
MTVILALLLLPAMVQAVSVSQSIDRVEMAFEDTASVEITITWDGSPTAYRFDKALRLQCAGLQVARFSSKVSSTGSGVEETTTKLFRYALSPTLSGVATIEPLTIEFVSWPDSVVGTLTTDPMTVTVAQPRAVTLSEDDSIPLWLVFVIGVVVLGAVFVGLLIYKRRKPKEVFFTPTQAFLKQLTVVKQEAGSDLKKFQTGLYQLLTTFVSLQYQINLSGKSAEAIAEELATTTLSPVAKEKISGWLIRAEKEKFAPVASTPGEVIRLEAEVRDLFEKM